MVASPWPDAAEHAAAPLLVAWRPDPAATAARQLSFTYLAEGLGIPAPEAETQGLLLLRPEDVRAIAHERHTLSSLLERGAQALLAGGDDYELCFTAPPSQVELVREEFEAEFSLALTRVGEVSGGAGVFARAPDGTTQAVERAGYQHFKDGAR